MDGEPAGSVARPVFPRPPYLIVANVVNLEVVHNQIVRYHELQDRSGMYGPVGLDLVDPPEVITASELESKPVIINHN